jgi:hypothetical protein
MSETMELTDEIIAHIKRYDGDAFKRQQVHDSVGWTGSETWPYDEFRDRDRRRNEQAN